MQTLAILVGSDTQESRQTQSATADAFQESNTTIYNQTTELNAAGALHYNSDEQCTLGALSYTVAERSADLK
jgi:hypothetical protein